MKHKILIAADQQTDTQMLLERVEKTLNSTHTKYLSLLMFDRMLKKELVPTIEQEEASSGILKKIEYELNFEKEAVARWMQFESVKSIENISELTTLSTVADLFVIDKKSALNKYGDAFLKELLAAVKCPVAVLPDHDAHDSIMVVHDGSDNVIHMVKNFLNIFNKDLRDLPLSVFVSDPDNHFQIETEKVFISYLKLFFKNIGIQLMDCEAAVCLTDHIRKEGLNPIVLVNGATSQEFINRNILNGKYTKHSATFVHKGVE